MTDLEKELYEALINAREFIRIFTSREDFIGDKAKDNAIAIDEIIEKLGGE